ncbi:MAG: phosphoribosyltransferase [Methanomassiliicoccales archaeon]
MSPPGEDFMDRVPAKIVTWDEIEKWCTTLSTDVRESGYTPDAIVGLARGGWIPARLLCDRLNISELYSLKTSHWGITATRDGKATLSGRLGSELAGKRVLVVDDITDTGESLKLAFEHVSSLSPADVRTATMLHITHSQFEPHHYAVVVPEKRWKWFIFPWNYYEDMFTFISRALEGGSLDAGAISAHLKRLNGLTFSPSALSGLLHSLESQHRIRRNGRVWSLP